MNNYDKFGKNKMKVCHVIWDTRIGGMEKYVLNLLKSMRNFVDVSLVHLGIPNVLWDEYEKLGIPIYCFNMRSGLDIKKMFNIYAFFRKNKFEIIHVHVPTLLFNFLLPLLKNKAKLVYTEHGGGLLAHNRRNIIFYKFFASNYDVLIAISHYMKKAMIEANPKIHSKVKVIYNGISLSKSFSLDKRDPKEERKKFLPHLHLKDKVIGIVVRLTEQKGIDIFLYIAKEILKKRNDVSFLVVGDGPLKNELLKLAQKLSVFNNVHFLGFRKDALNIMRCFDLFLLTSKWEPFGLVIIESMSVGVPVVALSCRGAVEELIKDKQTGFIIKEKTFPEIAEKILNIFDDYQQQEFIVKNAYEWIKQNFTIESNLKNLLNIYNEILLL